MEYRKLANTDYEHGVTSIETTAMYGLGRSEEIVGEALRNINDQHLHYKS